MKTTRWHYLHHYFNTKINEAHHPTIYVLSFQEKNTDHFALIFKYVFQYFQIEENVNMFWFSFMV